MERDGQTWVGPQGSSGRISLDFGAVFLTVVEV